MFDSFMGLLRKRMKIDNDQQQASDPEPTPSQNATAVDSDLVGEFDRKLALDPRNWNSQSPSGHAADEETMEVDSAHDIPSSSSGPTFSSSAASSAAVAMALPWDYAKSGDEGFHIDDRNVLDRPFNLNERFVTVLDQLDSRVEKLRKDAMDLQEKRDYLLMSIDLIKNNDHLHGMHEHEREEIFYYIHRVNSRLSTVELNVKTVRDASQEDSLHQVNVLIDSLITSNDPTMSRQRCQTFLNACSGSDAEHQSSNYVGVDRIVDKTFESALLGCTLDDQKNIKKRLQALMNYLNRQIISD